MKKIITFKIDKVNAISGGNFYLIDLWGGLDHKNHDYIANSYWSSKDNYYHTTIYMSGVLEKFVIDLANYLNNYHSENKDVGYWRIITSEWALYFLWQVFNQWELLNKISKDEECKFVLKNVKDKYRAPTCIDKHNFLDEDWNQLLFKDILDAMGKNNYEIIDYGCHKLRTHHLELHFPYQKLRRMAKKLRDLLFHRSKKFCDDALIITDDLIGYFGVDSDVVNYFPFKVEIFQYNTFISINKSDNTGKILNRPSIKHDRALDEFESVLYKIAHNFIPQSLMEGRSKYLKFTQKLINLGRPKAICSSGIDYLDRWSYYLAALKEADVPTYRYQHSASYGIEEVTPFLYWELDRYDTILSWGRCYEHNVIPSFYREPLNIKKIKREINEIDVLVVAYEPLIFRFGHGGMKDVTDPKIYETQINDAIQALVRNDFTHIVYKTRYYGDNEYGVSKRLSKNFAKIEIDKNTNAIELIKKSELVIVTYLSTAFIECLYENIPSVLYLNKNKDNVDEDIRSLFIEMELVGLVHWNIQSLDKFISLNKGMFQEWWTSDDLEGVKQKIMELLAIPSANPFYDVLNLVYQHSQSIHL